LPESDAVVMRALLWVSGAIDGVNERFGRIADWCVLLACLISAGNALVRYGFSFSSNAWLEIQWYLFAAMFMLGAPYTLRRNEHVRVDVIYGNLSARLKLWVDLLGAILFLMPPVLVIGWMSWPLFYDSWQSGEVSSNAGGLIRWPVKLLLPLGFGLLALQGFSEIIKRIAALRGYEGGVAAYEKPLQ
jgi:TRAP-type mannitol/chloroaromatic compound transport system permease small subunit